MEPLALHSPTTDSPDPPGVEELTRRHVELWNSTPSVEPDLGPVVSRRRQRANARATARLVDRMANRVETCPEDEDSRRVWREETREEVSRFGEERFGWPAGYRSLVCGDEFFETSLAFTREARAFDPTLGPEDLFQALRNVWIMNSVQMLLELPVELSFSIFAYSMLYPVTDNFLDDLSVSADEKRRFNRRLGRRLAGDILVPASRHEANVSRLIARIESQFPRTSWPGVWESLLAIHGGQVKSLAQQGPGARDLVATSVEKGGASVLADGYLTAGELRPSEAEFFFGYGVFLQFLDDLQDARTDFEAGHRTVFSRLVEVERLDEPASRLFALLHRVIDGGERFADPRYDDLKDLIRRNCVGLFVGAVADDPGLFSRGFVRHLERRWPIRFRALRRLKKRARKRFERTGELLRQKHGVRSVFELLNGEP